MGWLFAVALGLHRKSRGVLLLSLAPIALGHAASVAVVLGVMTALGRSLNPATLGAVAGLALLAWAAWHALYGHRRRVRFGMQAGLAALAGWSFLTASAHGAGVMLAPVALPLCGPAQAGGSVAGSIGPGLAALGLHTATMLTAILVVALIVYEWSGLAFLRVGWINFDRLWTMGLAGSGVLLLVA